MGEIECNGYRENWRLIRDGYIEICMDLVNGVRLNSEKYIDIYRSMNKNMNERVNYITDHEKFENKFDKFDQQNILSTKGCMK